ncbi:MAG: methyl-accepting chemotaxis protein [Ignavibacteriaceae bacterium]
MKRYWKKLKINQKILYPIVLVSILTGTGSYLYFHNLYEEAEVKGLVSKARTLITEVEAVRDYTAEQLKTGVFKTDLTRTEDILYTVPIFSAMKVAKSKAPELDMDFRVPKFQPRNPKNEPDDYEAQILRKLESGNVNETWEIDDATNSIRFFRPIKLTDECLKCHGDPSNSFTNWGTTNGTDLTGTKMEGWKTGEVHGAFEVIMDLAPVQASVNEKSIFIALISSIGIALIALIGFLVSRSISNPVKELESAADKIANGNTSISVLINSEDELGALASSFNAMVQKINKANFDLLEEKRSVEKKVEEAVRESVNQKNYLSKNVDIMLFEMNKFSEGDLTVKLTAEKEDEIGKLFNGFNRTISNIKNLIEKVSEAVHATASASAQISSSTEEMAAGAEEQNTQTSEVAVAIEQMSKTVIETTQNTTTAADNAKRAGEIAGEGGKVVTETVDGIQKIAEVVLKSSETVMQLGKSSDQIGEIVQVIDDIADQTNLLALNAAIEAARAGEQGRGFAVVADEVRKLAERTTKATKEIADMIKQIQKKTGEAVLSMNKGTEEVEKGKMLANKAGESLKEIINAAVKVVDDITQVATASEEQSNTTEQISRSIDSISNITHESSAAIQEVAKAAEDLNKLTDNLQNLISKFKVDAEDNHEHYSVRQNGKLIVS